MSSYAKTKLSADGFPSHIQTSQEKEDYAHDLSVESGLDILAEELFYSPANRMSSKIRMNSEVS
jgi:hypothetical protein